MSEVAGTNSAPVTVEEGGITVTSTSETPEAIQETLQSDPIADAAATLGKRSAEARKARSGTGETPAEVVPEQGGESTDSGGVEEPSTKLGKPRHDPKARMLEATRKEAEAKREAREAREEAARYKAELEGLRAPKAPEPVRAPVPANGEPAEPSLDDYPQYSDYLKDHSKWVRDYSNWTAEQALTRREAQYQQQAQVQAYVSGIDEVLGQAVAARTEHEKVDPQWFSRVSDEVKQIANQPSIARDLEEKLRADHVIADEIILAGQAGPRVMVHLSENPQDLERMRSAKSPIDIQIGMRMLAEKVLNSDMAAGMARLNSQPSVSQAKAPIRPVSGAPGGSNGPPGENASYAEHRAYYNRLDKAARR